MQITESSLAGKGSAKLPVTPKNEALLQSTYSLEGKSNMGFQLGVQLIDVKPATSFPGMWQADTFRAILRAAKLPSHGSNNELFLHHEVIKGLQQFTPEAAADIVLTVVMQNSSVVPHQVMRQELKREREWLHLPSLTAAILLHQIFPTFYPKPEFASMELLLTSSNDNAAFVMGNPTPGLTAYVVMVLLGYQSALFRLCRNPLANTVYLKPSSIIWHVEPYNPQPVSINWRVYASWHWLRPLLPTPSTRINITLDSPALKRLLNRTNAFC